jgi:ketosteroid isomerase-like protein
MATKAGVELERTHVEGDHVLAIGRLSREMPGSPSRIEVYGAFRMTFRDERIVRVEQFGTGPSFASAVEAAGLAA